MTAAQRALESITSAQKFEPELTEEASVLLTFNGYMNECTELLIQSKQINDRDEVACLNMRHKTLKLVAEIWGKVLTIGEDVDANDKLSWIQNELGRKASGATTSHAGDLNLPEIPNTGVNEL